MGLVRNQSVKNVVTTYLGFAVGALNVLLLYPHFLQPDYYGLVTFLLSASTLVWPLMGFGVQNTLIKFYTSYVSNRDRQRLLNLALFLPLGVGLGLGTLGLLFYESIQAYFSTNVLIKPYVWLIFVIALSIAYFEVFFAWGKLRLKSVFGNFMREVYHRVCISFLLLGVYAEWLSVENFIYALVLVYASRTVIIGVYAFRLLPPRLLFELPSNKWRVLKYSSLILIAGSVATALLDLDKVMIEHYLPIKNVSVYGIGVYIASVIAVPQRAMQQITNPITADFLNTKNKEGLRRLYQKSSTTLFLISGLIFALILTNVKDLYQLVPEEYSLSVSIILMLSLVKLYDNLLGNNNSILFNSDYYRLVLMIGLCIVALAIVLNILLIPRYGIFGAAVASFLAFAIFNSIKLWVVYRKFGIQPFRKKTAFILVLITAMTVAFYYISFGLHPILNILLKAALLTLVYLLVAYRFNFSEDVTQLIQKYLRFFKG